MSPEIAAQIQAEQNHGRQKYGSGPDDLRHDDQHFEESWFDFIANHLERARVAPGHSETRQHLVKIAGLAVSAIEAHDRRMAKMFPEAEKRSEYCEWVVEPMTLGRVKITSCGAKFDSPSGHLRFCPYCSKKIKEAQ